MVGGKQPIKPRPCLFALARPSIEGSCDQIGDGVVEPEAITTALALELERLAPFGVGNPRPRFLCPDLQLAVPPRLLKEEHVKLQLRGPEADIEALAWRRADLAESLLAAERVSLVATLRARKWQGRLTAQLEISDISA